MPIGPSPESLMRSLFLGLLLAVLAVPALADIPPIRAVRASRPIAVDGLLDEEVWKSDQAVTQFLEKDPDQGVTPRQKSEVRLAYDDDALYGGARLYDTAPDPVVARLARRDNDPNTDDFLIPLHPVHAKATRPYFCLAPPEGVQR